MDTKSGINSPVEVDSLSMFIPLFARFLAPSKRWLGMGFQPSTVFDLLFVFSLLFPMIHAKRTSIFCQVVSGVYLAKKLSAEAPGMRVSKRQSFVGQSMSRFICLSRHQGVMQLRISEPTPCFQKTGAIIKSYWENRNYKMFTKKMCNMSS